MAKEIIKEELSSETKDSMGNPVGTATKDLMFQMAEASHFLVLRRVKID